MDCKTKILFVDTNAFLQVRDLEDIPWKALFPEIQAVDVMVASRVIEELDKHKTSTNKRRRDRARLALHLIEQASLKPDLALVLRDKPVLVRIVISTSPRFEWAAYPNLDPAKPDDQIVAEALSFGNGAELLSHDAGPRIRARISNIRAHEPRPEWLLPVEQTDDQRKITKLERDLEQALSQIPKIVTGFDNFDEATSEIQIIRPVLRPLDSNLINRLSTLYLEDHPPASFNSAPFSLGPSASTIEGYRSKYGSFEEDVQNYYASLHDLVGGAGLAAAIDYFVRNDSGVTADGLRIEFDLEGAGSLLADREDAAHYIGSFKLPEPPTKPRGIMDNMYPLIDIPTLGDAMRPRDPVAFYWFDRPTIVSQHSARQCQDFRARREFRDRIFVLVPDKLPVELGLRLLVSAANLPAPVNAFAKILISQRAVEWSDPIVQAILPPGLRELLSTG